MWDIKAQILDASKSLDIVVKEIDHLIKNDILLNIRNKYILTDLRFPLWERLKDAHSKSDETAWKWVGDFVGMNSVIMFFNPTDEKMAFLLNSGKDLVSILGEMYNVEFYLTNDETDYLLCFTHHNILLASGEAKVWLEGYSRGK